MNFSKHFYKHFKKKCSLDKTNSGNKTMSYIFLNSWHIYCYPDHIYLSFSYQKVSLSYRSYFSFSHFSRAITHRWNLKKMKIRIFNVKLLLFWSYMITFTLSQNSTKAYMTVSTVSYTGPSKYNSKIDRQRLHVATGIAQFLLALKRTRGCIMTLDGSVEEYLSFKQNRKPAAPTYYEYPVPQEKDDSRI